MASRFKMIVKTLEHNLRNKCNILTHFYGPWLRIGGLWISLQIKFNIYYHSNHVAVGNQGKCECVSSSF